MSLQLTPDLEQRLQHLAGQTHRSPDELAQQGVEQFLAREEGITAAVQRGRSDYAAGRVVEPEQVLVRIDAILQGK